MEQPFEGYFEYWESRPDRVWWLLAPNPFVILADAGPRVPARITRSGDLVYIENYDPLSSIGNEVRRLRTPYPAYGSVGPPPLPEERPVWPYGLAFSVLLGAGSLVITTVRLRTPTDRLPRGVRVA